MHCGSFFLSAARTHWWHITTRVAFSRMTSMRCARCNRLPTPRHATPRLASPRHATPRLASPRLAQPEDVCCALPGWRVQQGGRQWKDWPQRHRVQVGVSNLRPASYPLTAVPILFRHIQARRLRLHRSVMAGTSRGACTTKAPRPPPTTVPRWRQSLGDRHTPRLPHGAARPQP